MKFDARTSGRKLIFQEEKVGISTRIKGHRFACREVNKTKNHPLKMILSSFSGLLRNVRSQAEVSIFADDLSIICCCVLLKQGSEILL